MKVMTAMTLFAAFAAAQPMWHRSGSPRAAVNRETPDAERLLNLSALMSKAGTYEVSGTTLTTHIQVADNMGSARPGNSDVFSLKIEGNTLWITDVHEGGKPSANPVTLKLIRME